MINVEIVTFNENIISTFIFKYKVEKLSMNNIKQ